jgi:hypothetical protein
MLFWIVAGGMLAVLSVMLIVQFVRGDMTQGEKRLRGLRPLSPDWNPPKDERS